MNNKILIIIIISLLISLLLSLFGRCLINIIKNFFIPFKKIKCAVINKIELKEVRGTSIYDNNSCIKAEYIVIFQSSNGNKIKENVSKNHYLNINIGDSGFIYYKGAYYKGFNKVGD